MWIFLVGLGVVRICSRMGQGSLRLALKCFINWLCEFVVDCWKICFCSYLIQGSEFGFMLPFYKFSICSFLLLISFYLYIFFLFPATIPSSSLICIPFDLFFFHFSHQCFLLHHFSDQFILDHISFCFSSHFTQISHFHSIQFTFVILLQYPSLTWHNRFIRQ